MSSHTIAPPKSKLIYKEYVASQSLTISNNGRYSLTPAELGLENIPGYTLLSICEYTSGSYYVDTPRVGYYEGPSNDTHPGETCFMQIRGNGRAGSGNSTTVTPRVALLWARDDLVKVIPYEDPSET